MNIMTQIFLTLIAILMKAKSAFVLIIIALSISACDPQASKQQAAKAVEDSGLTDVIIVGSRIFGCDKNDFWKWEFTAKNVQGRAVHGVVCGGLVAKGWTIRFE